MRGIPEIQENWQTQNVGLYIDYINPVKVPKRAQYLMKRVFVDEHGQIQKEIDEFYSGKSYYYQPDQIQLPQGITLTYDYSPSKSNDPWWVVAQLGPEELMKDISIQEADTLLQNWGLHR